MPDGKTCPVCGYAGQKSERSINRLRMMHAMCDMLWKAYEGSSECWESRERLRYWLTVKAGFYDVIAVIPAASVDRNMLDMISGFMKSESPKVFFVPRKDGSIEIRKAKSVAFGKMSEEDFGELLDRMMDVVVEMIPSITHEHIRSHLEEITGLNFAEHAR